MLNFLTCFVEHIKGQVISIVPVHFHAGKRQEIFFLDGGLSSWFMVITALVVKSLLDRANCELQSIIANRLVHLALDIFQPVDDLLL
jgi:hypothetical protein